MADTFKWTAGGEGGVVGCPGTVLPAGWYKVGDPTPLATTWKNPATGAMYTPQELGAITGGGATTGTPIANTNHPNSTLPANTAGQIFADGKPLGNVTPEFSSMSQEEQEAFIKTTYGVDVAGKPWSYGGTAPKTATTPAVTTPLAIPQVTMPNINSINVPAPTVTPAPAFEITPEQQAWQDKVGGYISETLEMGGRGIPQETMDLMVGKTTDTLKAKETEDLRVMKNNMERRGITNSGFIFSNEQKIRSGTTMALANSITDLNIQNQLMKVASFETAMGQAAQYLGYLGEMSALKNAPATQTWMAQTQANLYQFQGKLDIYKTQLQAAYQTQNTILQGQISMQLQKDAQVFEKWKTEVELEATKAAAQAEGAGKLAGASIGGMFSLIKPS